MTMSIWLYFVAMLPCSYQFNSLESFLWPCHFLRSYFAAKLHCLYHKNGLDFVYKQIIRYKWAFYTTMSIYDSIGSSATLLISLSWVFFSDFLVFNLLISIFLFLIIKRNFVFALIYTKYYFQMNFSVTLRWEKKSF